MPAKERTIFHIDCNAFYASVEEVLFPEFKKVPMAICGNPKSRRGIILAKNELAKKYHIKTAETIWQAKKKCPDLVLRPARHDLYTQYSQKINKIYGEYTDQVEPYGRDESYLDVTGSLHLFGGDAIKLAHEIRKRIPGETGLTVSVGVSFNKIFAKLASDMKKPDAVSVIHEDNFKQIVWQMPVSDFLMVGKSTGAALKKMNILTIGDLANADESHLEHRFGKLGAQLHRNAKGLDNSPVISRHNAPDVHSIGNGTTFKHDLITEDDIKTAITALSDSVATRLRRQDFKCATVQVTIKDSSFKVITRQKPVAPPTWLAEDLMNISMAIIKSSWKIGHPIRMLTVTALKLIHSGQVAEQLSIFDALDNTYAENQVKKENLEFAIDKIHDKYGKPLIVKGNVLYNTLGINEDYDNITDE